MSAPEKNKSPASQVAKGDPSAREAITFYNALEERETDKAPLQAKLIRRIFHYTKPYAAKRNWLFLLTFLRGLQLPALAWLIGGTINGPISHRMLPDIYWYAAAYFALALITALNFHFRQRFALELGETVVHDMRSELFAKLMTMPVAFFNQTKFGRIISRMTSDIDSVRAGRGVRAGGARVADGRVGDAHGVVRLETVFIDGAARADHLAREQKLPAGDGPAHAQGAGIVEPGVFDPGRIRERHPGDAGVCPA